MTQLPSYDGDNYVTYMIKVTNIVAKTRRTQSESTFRAFSDVTRLEVSAINVYYVFM